MLQHLLVTADRDGAVAIGRDDLIRYAGPTQVIASALVFRLFERAFADLSSAVPPPREAISVLSAFPGEGVLDGIEMVTRARSRGRLVLDPAAGPVQAPPAPGGRFYFEVGLGAARFGYWPAEGYFDARFRDQVARFQDAPDSPERELFLAYKMALAGRLLGAPAAALFHRREVPTP